MSAPTGRAAAAVGALAIAVGALLAPPVQRLLGVPASAFANAPPTVFAWLCAIGVAGAGVMAIAWRRRIGPAELTLAAVSCLVSLAAVEIALKTAGFGSPRRLGRRHPPLAAWWAYDPVDGNRLVPGKYYPGWPVNAEGFLDTDEFDCAGGCAAPRRVLLAGDSYTFGIAATAFENTFAARLESRLAGEGGVLLWNTGMPGIGPPQQLHQLREYLPRLKPQVVVLGFFENDFLDSLLPVGALYRFEDGMAVYRYYLDEAGAVAELSPLESYRKAVFAPESLTGFLGLTRTGHFGFRLVQRAVWAVAPPPPRNLPCDVAAGDLAAFEARVQGFAKAREYVAEMKALCAAHGARMMAFVVPHPTDLGEIPTLRYCAGTALLDSLGIEHIDLRPALRPDDFEKTWHWTDSGHAKVSEVLYPALRDRLPPP